MYRIAVTNRHLCKGDFLSKVEQLAKGNDYQAILLREKDLPEDEYEILAKEVLRLCRKENKKCILHSFPNVALRLQHPFLHLPLPIWHAQPPKKQSEIREFVMKLGTSIHSLEQLQQAKTMGVTYVLAGHIFPTDCKKDLPPRGLSFLQSVCQKATIPVIGIGGIDKGNESLVIESGAFGVGVMSGCMED